MQSVISTKAVQLGRRRCSKLKNKREREGPELKNETYAHCSWKTRLFLSPVLSSRLKSDSLFSPLSRLTPRSLAGLLHELTYEAHMGKHGRTWKVCWQKGRRRCAWKGEHTGVCYGLRDCVALLTPQNPRDEFFGKMVKEQQGPVGLDRAGFFCAIQ